MWPGLLAEKQVALVGFNNSKTKFRAQGTKHRHRNTQHKEQKRKEKKSRGLQVEVDP
jgi:hypothetical protein